MWRKSWDKHILYKTRFEKLRRGEMYVLSKKGAVDSGVRGHYDPPKLWFPCWLPVFLRVHVVRAMARVEVDTSAWRLSEAKTQRRPSARERECVRGGGFLCCFVVVFVSFFEQGRRRHVEEDMLAKRGEWVKRGGGLRRATA